MSRRVAVLTAKGLAGRLARLGPQRPVPLLVMRLGELERIAWRDGRAAALRFERCASSAFATVGARAVRSGDLLAHEPRSLLFSVALAGSPRTGAAPDCRATLARASGALSAALGVGLDGGWTLASVGSNLELEREMRAALARGEREREKFEFFSIVGHELRAPLTSIRGFLETVLDERPAAGARRRYLEIARGEALRLSRLVDGMYRISLLDLSSTRLASEDCVPLRETIEEALAPLEPRMRGCAVKCRLPDATFVAIGRDDLTHVCLNVVGNALDHGRPNGTIAIGASRGEDSSTVVTTIDDDGPGIPDDELDAVFELGYRARDARRGGSGLGLALVRRLVERCGGNVRAQRSPLGGTRIVIELIAREPPC
ncbi:MAG: HAMP domain-containing histidine kinase [Candidatus Eremiobacteraeota bacterium]|nr:HAMP domain-containing histidine kinase [Candidatus Eremiobacteraeota bacterium]